jgi:hypothetical protein
MCSIAVFFYNVIKRVTLMLMIKKKPILLKEVPLPRIRIRLPSKKTVLISVVVLIVGVFSYSKYIDYRNVQDMKQLLADFEQLEKDVEAETNEDLYIEAECGSVGKFATSYACSLRLLHSRTMWSSDITNSVIKAETDNMKDFGRCRILSEKSIGFKPNEDNYICSFSVHDSNREKSEEIFYQYDTSPGSPY